MIESQPIKTHNNKSDSESVKSMFGRIARRYDLANNILSLGIYRHWYRKLIGVAAIRPGMKILDVACGTGNLGIMLKTLSVHTTSQRRSVGTMEVVGIDFSEEMLYIARHKAKKKKLDIKLEKGDATALPYPNDYFDRAAIAYGIRNVATIEKCLDEMLRVTKSGGKILILEFGQPYLWFQPIFNLYSRIVIRNLGIIITKDKMAYQYLVETSSTFPCGEKFIEIMKVRDGAENPQFKALLLGIAYLYMAEVKK